MVVSVKSSTFSTGADSALAAVDVYNIDSSTKLTTLTDLSSDSIGTDVNSVIGSTDKSTKKLTDEISALKTSTVSSDVVSDKIKAVDADGSAAIDSLTASEKTVINSNINNNSLTNKIEVSVNGIKSYISSSAASTLSTIDQVLSKVTNSVVSIKASDIGGSIAVVSSAVRSALNIGIDGTLGAVLKTITDQPTKNALCKSLLNDVINKTAINDLHAISTNTSGGLVLQSKPKLVQEMVSKFKSHSDYSDNELDSNLSTMFSSFNNIYGNNNWHAYSRNSSDTSISLYSLLTTNKHFKNAVERMRPNLSDYGVTDKNFLGVLKNISKIQPTTVKESINTNHPYVYVEDNPQKKIDLTLENLA